MQDIKEFYDRFLIERMVNYRIDGNIRIDAAIQLALKYVRPGSRIADVGCGIGLVSEALAKFEPTAHVFGVDISAANILYAKRTICLGNVHFFSASATAQFEELRKRAGGLLDIICMVDVIEHIREADRAQLFKNLAGITNPDGFLILTYPSPEYQRFLLKEKPDELQIIDTVVEIRPLLAEADAAGWQLHDFKYVDVWQRNHISMRCLRARYRSNR